MLLLLSVKPSHQLLYIPMTTLYNIIDQSITLQLYNSKDDKLKKDPDKNFQVTVDIIFMCVLLRVTKESFTVYK